MRIIAGEFKGRRLMVKGSKVRPTSDRVKGALFSILRGDINDANFLDLCSGTGNIGIEALSRGAKLVTFVDRDYHCIRVIASNLEQCGIHRNHSQVQLINLAAQKGLTYLGKRHAQFDLIYIDPPYDANIHNTCLELVAENRLLSQSGRLVVEHRRGKEINFPTMLTKGLTLNRQEGYGDTILSFYKWGENE
jgi:16S rRNA (guanine966-N2)-methyltransferase